MKKLTEKTPAESEVIMTQMVLPGDTNALGTIFGGKIMEWLDIAGAISARRHAQKSVVTASIDALSFIAPIRIGQIVTIQGRVNWTGHSSMEVGCIIDAEDPSSGEHFRTARAYLTYVALDSNGRPTKIPSLRLESSEDNRRFSNALKRREARLKLKNEMEK